MPTAPRSSILTLSKHARSPRHASPPEFLEPLEPRVLLTAFQFVPGAPFDFPTVLHQFTPPQGVAAETFGAAAAVLGDLDGDGIPDLAISAPGRPASGASPDIPGAVGVYSGRTGELLRLIQGTEVGFGAALAAMGDINGDGTPDLLVGSPEQGGGAAYFISGADGAVLHTITGAFTGGELGRAVATITDLDGDGVADAIIGAPAAGPLGQGEAYLVSGATGEIIRTFTGEAAGDRFGAAVNGQNDYNVDTVRDIFVGAPFHDSAGEDAGRVYIFGGVSGTLLHIADGLEAGDEFGAALGRFLSVGAPGHDGGAGRIFSLLFEPHIIPDAVGTGRFGHEIVDIGRVDADASPDLAVGSDNRADRRLRSGGSISALPLSPLPANESPLGDRILGGADFNGDGVADVITIVDGVVRIISGLALVPPGTNFVASPDLSWIVTTRPAAGGVSHTIVIHDGVILPPGDPAVPPGNGFVVVAVNSRGDIAYTRPVLPAPPQPTNPPAYLHRDGVSTPIADLIAEVVGAPAPNAANLVILGLSEAGHLLLEERPPLTPPAAGVPIWVLDPEGTLRFAYEGIATAINAQGLVIGWVWTDGGESFTPVAWSAQTGLFTLDGLHRADAVTDTGDIYGRNEALNLARWRDGVVTELAVLPAAAPVSWIWSIVDVRDDGAVLLNQFLTGGGLPSSSADYLYTPQDGLQVLSRFVYGEAPDSGLALATGFGPGGTILLRDGRLVPIADSDPFVLAEDAPIFAGAAVVAVNQFGDTFAFTRDAAGTWRASRLTGLGAPAPTTARILTFTNPGDARTHIVVVDGAASRWSVIEPDGTVRPLPGFPLDEQIVSNATLMMTPDGRAAVVGLSAQGELVAVFQAALGSGGAESLWATDNLTARSLLPQGFTPPAPSAATGELTTFTTRWGTQHIAYLDDVGNINVIWWAPGMDRWTYNNISLENDAPALSGRLTAFVTSWDTLHFMANDQGGDLTALWWAPDFDGRWVATRLTPDAAAARRLDGATLTAFITPWETLHIAGLDADTGETTVYWWSPITQEWRADTLVPSAVTPPETPGDAAIAGPVEAFVTPEGVINLYGRSEGGDLLRLFWQPGGDDLWRMESLTRLVS